MRTGLVFAALIERMTGIVLPEREFERLGDLAAVRASMLGLEGPGAYLHLLRRKKDSREWRYILQQITIKESSLFRGPAQFNVLCQEIIPERMAAGRREIRIWSAGCARGEEPATLAVVLAECPLPPGVRIRIFATDVDREAMMQGKRAEFSRRAIRRTPPDLLDRYFVCENSRYRLKEAYSSRIEFSYFNLVDLPFAEEWRDFDVIFLRNVLIYFRETVQGEVIRAVADSLSEGGYLFVGPSESLWSIDSGLSRHSFSSCFAYRKGGGGSPEGIENRPVSQSLPGTPFFPDENTVEGREDEGQGIGPADAGVSADSSRRLRELVALISKGRFDLADQLLMRSGIDPVDARLGAVEGIIFRCKGKKEEAVRSFRAALYLDESLYQVRYLLALSLKEAGWADRARVEFEAVLKMLSTGGGREIQELAPLEIPGRLALEQLCRGELGWVLREKHSSSPPDGGSADGR